MTSAAPTPTPQTSPVTAPLDPDHTTVLDRLAVAVGIESSYIDVMGSEHFASIGAKKATLTAMGWPVETFEQAQAALLSLRQSFLAQCLPAVSVLRRSSSPFQLTVQALSDRVCTWHLALEDGSVLEGQAPLSVDETPISVAQMAREEALLLPLPGETGAEDGMVAARPRRSRLSLPEEIPDGYHRLELTFPDCGQTASGLLIVAPETSWLPSDLHQGHRIWGIGAQVYSLRSAHNWGMGDMGDLTTLCALTGKAGGAVVGINPMHALFLPKPEDASPYSPNSRLFLNPLYIAVELVPEYATCADAKGRLADPTFSRTLKDAREADHVRYTDVARLKRDILPLLFSQFQALPTSSARRQAYEAYVEDGGERLLRFAIFQALQDHHCHAPWPQWPSDYHSPTSPAVISFARDHAEDVEYHLWLQFECDRQLAGAALALREHDGTLGLYRDLAVGASPDGADTWMDADSYVLGARFGAPPDALGPLGQDWGLPPFDPHRLAQAGFAPFIDMVRANMRHAGALRIDHAMALQHLFWIPPGLTAKDGLYITYPIDALVAILAIESHRAQCLVIGEDLGTVPAEFRARMVQEGILSYRLLYFERYENGLFMRPETYPPLALATPTSHDLATIAGNWRGWDVVMRHRLGIAGPDGDEQADLQSRAEDRNLLRAALIDQGLIDSSFPAGQDLGTEALEILITACHRFLARAPSMLMLANLDDLCGEITQVNVPGTVCEYPNWRRRLSISLEDLAASPSFAQALEAITQER